MSEQPEFAISGLRSWRLREPASGRAYTVIRVDTQGGPRGYGECRGAPIESLTYAAQMLKGKQATAHEVVRVQMKGMPAIGSAVNMALLDILGKVTKAPVYQVLGGPTRNKARVMAPIYGDTQSALHASRDGASAFGYRAFVTPTPGVAASNQGQAFVNATRRRMDALRETGGESSDYVLQGAGALSPGDAASISAALEKFHLLWFDEPCRLSNLGAIRKLSDENVTPLGFGRTLREPGEFQDLLREQCVDVLRPDLGTQSLMQIRKLAALAETYYVAVAPHHAGGPIATAAALHLAASLPNFFIQEIPHSEAERDQQMRAEIVGKSVEKITAGYAALPVGPGLGIQVNEEALDKYQERAA
jgi:galactonate dehydratase